MTIAECPYWIRGLECCEQERHPYWDEGQSAVKLKPLESYINSYRVGHKVEVVLRLTSYSEEAKMLRTVKKAYQMLKKADEMQKQAIKDWRKSYKLETDARRLLFGMEEDQQYLDYDRDQDDIEDVDLDKFVAKGLDAAEFGA
jgi:hypothetical protein